LGGISTTSSVIRAMSESGALVRSALSSLFAALSIPAWRLAWSDRAAPWSSGTGTGGEEDQETGRPDQGPIPARRYVCSTSALKQANRTSSTLEPAPTIARTVLTATSVAGSSGYP
jgi:hypothetical protein